MNNKIKVISHRAYSFRKTDHYITTIWRGREDLPLAPVP
jgi:transposase